MITDVHNSSGNRQNLRSVLILFSQIDIPYCDVAQGHGQSDSRIKPGRLRPQPDYRLPVSLGSPGDCGEDDQQDDKSELLGIGISNARGPPAKLTGPTGRAKEFSFAANTVLRCVVLRLGCRGGGRQFRYSKSFGLR